MIDTYSEEWRRECEAREILSWSLEKRRRHLALVTDKRGWEARYYLEEEITRLWKLQKTQQQKQGNSSLSKAQYMAKQKQTELI